MTSVTVNVNGTFYGFVNGKKQWGEWIIMLEQRMGRPFIGNGKGGQGEDVTLTTSCQLVVYIYFENTL